jgi:hypothetical protein
MCIKELPLAYSAGKAVQHPMLEGINIFICHAILRKAARRTNLVAEGIKLARYDSQHKFIRQQTAVCDDFLSDATDFGPLGFGRRMR